MLNGQKTYYWSLSRNRICEWVIQMISPCLLVVDDNRSISFKDLQDNHIFIQIKCIEIMFRTLK